MRGQKNKAFFKDTKQDNVFGGGNINGALKRAKQTGFLNLQNRELDKFPHQIVNFAEMKDLIEQWWDAHPLEKVDLSGNNFVEIHPDLCKNEPMIGVLRISNNKLRLLPETLPLLKDLKLLDVSVNELKELPPNIASCQALVELNVARNSLVGVPANLGLMANLEVLNLSNNKIVELPPSISQLTKLKKLLLQENHLVVVPAAIGQLELLTELSLSKNRITQIEGNSLSRLAHLIQLDLHQNRLDSFSEVPVSQKLDSLILSVNRITDLTNLPNAPNLSNIDLDTNKINKVPKSIFTLGKLSSLNLSNNDINTLPGELGVMNTLKKIHIEGNPLKAVPAKFRQVTTNVLKEYLKKKLEDAEQEEYKMEVEHNPQHAAMNFGKIDEWEMFCRQFFVGGVLDVKGKNLDSINVSRLMEFQGQLHTLDVSKNNISSLSPEIGHLYDLKVLRLSQNKLTDPLPASLCDLASLKELTLSKNNLKEFPCIVMDNVEIVNLGGNGFLSVPDCFAFWPKLRQIIMPYNKITDVENLACENFQKLEVLDLSSNKVQQLSKEFAYYLQKLNFLNLENNELKKLPNALGNIPNLKSLNVAGNPIKLIRRAVLDKGTEGIREYLRNRFTEATDGPQDTFRQAPPLKFRTSEIMVVKRQEEKKMEPVHTMRRQMAQVSQAPFMTDPDFDKPQQAKKTSAQRSQPPFQTEPPAVVQQQQSLARPSGPSAPVAQSGGFKQEEEKGFQAPAPKHYHPSFESGITSQQQGGYVGASAAVGAPQSGSPSKTFEKHTHYYSSISFGGDAAPAMKFAPQPKQVNVPAQFVGSQQTFAEPKAMEIPPKHEASTSELQSEISKLNSEITKMTDDLDNNFSLSKTNRNALKRELNHKIVKRNQLLNQISQ